MEVSSWENPLFLWAMASMAILVITRGFFLCDQIYGLGPMTSASLCHVMIPRIDNQRNGRRLDANNYYSRKSAIWAMDLGRLPWLPIWVNYNVSLSRYLRLMIGIVTPYSPWFQRSWGRSVTVNCPEPCEIPWVTPWGRTWSVPTSVPSLLFFWAPHLFLLVNEHSMEIGRNHEMFHTYLGLHERLNPMISSLISIISLSISIVAG